jgi:hypothetical protein
MRRRHRIESAEQLMAICPAARALVHLTHPVSDCSAGSRTETLLRLLLLLNDRV